MLYYENDVAGFTVWLLGGNQCCFMCVGCPRVLRRASGLSVIMKSVPADLHVSCHSLVSQDMKGWNTAVSIRSVFV